MPNGDAHDDRELWERVRDLQEELGRERATNVSLKAENKTLAADNASLLRTIQMLKSDQP